MHGHDFYSLYSTKALEYVIAIAYILLFIPFWRFVNGGKQPAVARARATAADAVGATAAVAAEPGWFQVPDGVYLHPGHAWARVVGDEVRVGLDEFGHRLVGALDALTLPQVGDTLRQGEAAFALQAEGKSVDLLAPVDGEVTAVNRAALERPAATSDSPYDAGWLVTLKSPRLAASLKQLVSGASAQRWLDEAFGQVSAASGRELGLVMQDGGAPIHGLARALRPAAWDEVARPFFRS
jgi:glycine cleavage system H lipoate-binding protein